jgi:hypothetical protein
VGHCKLVVDPHRGGEVHRAEVQQQPIAFGKRWRDERSTVPARLVQRIIVDAASQGFWGKWDLDGGSEFDLVGLVPGRLGVDGERPPAIQA